MVTARMAMVRAILQKPDLLPDVKNADPSLMLAVVLKQEFPDLPDQITNKVVPKWKTIDSNCLPWSRRRRRQLERAKRVVIHLYSGQDEKTWRAVEDKETAVICIDKRLGNRMNMLADDLMLYLMKLAPAGCVAAILGGPPCRTISACRHAEDDGPGPVRSEEEPSGLATLSQHQRESVEADIVMLYRNVSHEAPLHDCGSPQTSSSDESFFLIRTASRSQGL